MVRSGLGGWVPLGAWPLLLQILMLSVPKDPCRLRPVLVPVMHSFCGGTGERSLGSVVHWVGMVGSPAFTQGFVPHRTVSRAYPHPTAGAFQTVPHPPNPPPFPPHPVSSFLPCTRSCVPPSPHAPQKERCGPGRSALHKLILTRS